MLTPAELLALSSPLSECEEGEANPREESAPTLLGLPLWPHGRAALHEHLIATAREERRHIVELHSVNAEICIQVRENDRFFDLLKNNRVNLIDGEWIRRFANFKFKQKFERISGSDCVPELCTLAAEQGWRVFQLGASEVVSRKAAGILRERNPGLYLARYSPPFERDPVDPSVVSPETTAIILEKLATARPHVLIACLGTPKQELWLEDNREALLDCGIRIVIGAGGCLDFLAGKVKRAPRFVSASGFEWLWRFALEPRVRFRRMASRLPRFLALGLTDAVHGRLRRVRVK